MANDLPSPARPLGGIRSGPVPAPERKEPALA